MNIYLIFLLVAQISAIRLFDASKITPDLLNSLSQSPRVNILVTLKDGTSPILERITRTLNNSTLDVRRTSVYNALKDHTTKSQKSVLEYLRTQPTIKFTPFWITNKIAVSGASLELIEALSRFDEIAEISEDAIIQIEMSEESEPKNAKSVQWNVEKIGANTVWREFGKAGEGVVVGVIDTGIRATHQALRQGFRKSYGWYDPVNYSARPFDAHGHGTHVSGSIMGKKGYGVAPKAQVLSCQAFGSRGRGLLSAIISCGQWIACPTTPSGQNPDCSKAPRIVNNSWGSTSWTAFYDEVISAWHALDIIPIFAIGNSGPRCESTGYPGNRPDVIGVGATTKTDALAGFSSAGPSPYGISKPDLSAPGRKIMSVGKDSDTQYVEMSGTSMASPHVAGVVALMLSIKPELKFREIKYLLEKTAHRGLEFEEKTCGTTNDSVFPNNFFGHGRVDALAVIKKIKGTTF